MRGTGRLTVMLVVVTVLGLGFLVERLVVTDREAIEGLVADATAAARDGDLERLRGLLAEDYEGQGGSRDGAVRQVASFRSEYAPQGLRSTVQKIDLAEDGETAVVRVNVKGIALARPFLVHLVVEVGQSEDGWEIRSARVGHFGS